MSRGRRAVPLWLDHASLSVPVLADALLHLDERLRLRATVSPAAPHRHSRIHLHRTYLEVAADPGAAGWDLTHFFLRFEDPETVRAHLQAAGISARFGVYEGVDGRWDDVELDAGPVPLPVLVRRTDPPDVARGWPPPLPEPHPCGAISLAAVHVGVREWAPAVGSYRRLLGTMGQTAPTAATGDDRRRLSLPLACGRLELIEGETAGIIALELGVVRLEETRAVLGLGLGAERDGVVWLDPEAAFGLHLGFVETGGADPRDA